MTGLTDINGVRVGHWTDAVGLTGCSVVLLPVGTVGSGEVRGGAPGSREWALLDPGRVVDAVDAVVLTGGSAFGLAACDGVMAWCEEQGRGWPTPAGPVPIVVGLVIYDLANGDPLARPGRPEGYGACRQASAGPVPSGRLGAGTGATVGKWRGPAATRPGGLGSASESDGDLIVAALVAVNAIGDIRPADGNAVPLTSWPIPPEAGTNTTIGVVVTNAGLTKQDCHRVAASAHDGLARAIEPVHLTGDGDAFVAAATGVVAAPVDQVASLAARAVEVAIRLAGSG
ncbi:MAG: P1 family peptidase [Acidimicrobiales bacterium]